MKYQIISRNPIHGKAMPIEFASYQTKEDAIERLRQITHHYGRNDWLEVQEVKERL